MKKIQGEVISNKMNKTIVIERVVRYVHPLYKKTIMRHRRIKAHSDIPLEIGDRVVIESIRPMSKQKHYKVVEKLTAGK